MPLSLVENLGFTPAPRPLLITPKPYLGESYRGYLLRVSEKNGYHSPSWMVRQLGIRTDSALRQGGLTIMAEALKQKPRELAKLIGFPLVHNPRWLRLMGHEIHRCTFEKRHNRVCPACLKEHGWIKSVWELKPYICCPEHGSYLVDQCPGCSKPISFDRAHLTKCKCGQDLCEIPTMKASHAAVQLNRQIEGLFKGGNAKAIPAPFASLDLSELLNHILFLATYLSGRGRGTGRQLMYQISAQASLETFERVAAAISDWPHSFQTLLDDIRQHSAKVVNQTGLEAEFQTFYTGLYGRSRESQGLEIIKEAFSDYVRVHWDGGAITSKNSRLGFSSDSPEQYVTLAEAARYSHIHPSILKQDIEIGRLKSVERTMKSRRLRLICRQDLERYRIERRQLIAKPDAMKLLGLSKKPFMALVQDGILKAAKGPRQDGSALWCFERSHLNNLLHTLFTGLRTRPIRSGEVSFQAAIRKASAKGLGISALIQAMLAGNLKAVCREKGKSGLPSLCFQYEALQEILLKANSTVDWGIPIRQAARYLRLNEEATRDLVRSGLLKTTNAHENGRLHKLVSFEAMERFKETYASASDVAMGLKTSPKAAVHLLKDRGITPATGPAIDGTRQYFYARKQVKPYLNQRKRTENVSSQN